MFFSSLSLFFCHHISFCQTFLLTLSPVFLRIPEHAWIPAVQPRPRYSDLHYILPYITFPFWMQCFSPKKEQTTRIKERTTFFLLVFSPKMLYHDIRKQQEILKFSVCFLLSSAQRLPLLYYRLLAPAAKQPTPKVSPLSHCVHTLSSPLLCTSSMYTAKKRISNWKGRTVKNRDEWLWFIPENRFLFPAATLQ